MGRDTLSWIVPDGLREIADPLIPPSKVRPEGGGTQDTPDETLMAGLQTRHDPENGWHYKPRKLHADKAYDVPDLRRWLRGKRIGARIARKGIESSERLGRRRWVIEQTSEAAQ
jgi:hypothetical protein